MMVKNESLGIGETLDYFKALEAFPPDDFPLDKFSGESELVIDGMRQLWAMIHMRRFLNDTLPDHPKRRDFELQIRNQAALLRESINQVEADRQTAITQRKINNLMTIHHLSVTADQAELSATAF